MDKSLEEALRPDFEVETQPADLECVFESFAALEIDVVVLEITRAEIDVVRVLTSLRAWSADVTLVVVAADLADDVVLAALRLDVSGLVIDPPSAVMVAHCVRQVRDGHLCLDQRILRRAVKVLAERQIAAREAAKLLTPRELEIVRLVGRGLTNKEIATALFVAEGTIKVHVHNIFDKLGLRSRKELAAFAKEKGLL
jgi:DNA-binding NarL/FixJ family response regulator